jgi:antitoxin component YwqK of YwqJK toxin-antitoxin module
MKKLIFIIITLLINYGVWGQYSLKGSLATLYSADSLIPITGVYIRLLEKNVECITNKNGQFNFESIASGKYSLEINGLNKIIIRNIELNSDLILDTIRMIIDYSYSPKMVVHSAWSAEELKRTFSENGGFIKDTLSNNYYEQGIYIPEKTIPDSTNPYRDDYLWYGNNYYRQGEWKWKNDSINIVENYNKGKLNGSKLVYYENGQLISIGAYVDNVRVGVWKFYDKQENLFQIEFQNSYVIIDLKTNSIKEYNKRVQNIYNTY